MLAPVLYTVPSHPRMGDSRNARAHEPLYPTELGTDLLGSKRKSAFHSCLQAAHRPPLPYCLSCSLRLFREFRHLLAGDLRNHDEKIIKQLIREAVWMKFILWSP